ncbi:hypothetical protein [Roseobacter phage RDJL6]|nr:hypothetical protein [Roseobacter phage RDJL6]
MTDPNTIQQNAIIEELQVQRGFMGDRAVNLAADLARANARIEELQGLVAATAKERDEWKNKAASQGELALGT